MLIVEALTADGPGAQVGLRAGDQLLAYDGHLLSSPAQFQALSENADRTLNHALHLCRKGEEVRTLPVPAGDLGGEVRPELPIEVLSLYRAGQERRASGVVEETLSPWMEAAERAQDPTVSAWFWMRIGKIYEEQKAWALAQGAYARTEPLLESADSAVRYCCAMALGNYLEKQQAYEQACERYLAALAFAESSGYALWLAASLHNLGRIAYDRRNPSLALDYYHRALEIRERLAPDSLELANTLNNMGLIAYHGGDMSLAESYFRPALEIRERLAPNSPEVARSLHHIGNVACDRGDLLLAEDYYHRSLAIWEALMPDSTHTAFCIHGLGIIAAQRGDYAKAEKYHRRALPLYQRFAPDSLYVAGCLHSLSFVAFQRDELALGEEYQQRALEIRERLAPNSTKAANSLEMLGSIALRRGEVTKAEAYLHRALAIHEHLTPNTTHVAHPLHNLGDAAGKRGDLAAAEDYYRRALAVWERLSPNSVRTSSCLHSLAAILQKRHKFAQALPLHLRAVAILESQRYQIPSIEARSFLLAEHIQKYLGLLQTYLHLKNLAEAFAVVERARARSFVEMLVERRLNFTLDAPTELLQKQQALDQQRGQTYTALATLNADADTAQVQNLQAYLQDLEIQQQQLTAQIRAASPRFASLQYPQPLDLQGAQTALDPGTLALVYQTDEQETFLFAVTHDRCDLHRLPIGHEELAQQVAAFRKALDVRLLENTLQNALSQARSLYTTLLAPAKASIKKAKRLLLCPEGPLQVLPFTCLVTNNARKPRYLAEEIPLHQTVSLTVYAQTRHDKQQRRPQQDTPSLSERIGAGISSLLQTGKRLLALGDPLYPPLTNLAPLAEARSANPEREALQSRGLSLTPLPFSRQEVEGIGALFGEQASLHLGAQATKTIVKQECAQAGIVHFACHGWLDHRFPLSSALVLSQPEALGEQAVEGDNGLLQAWEVMEQMKLEAELVVLSACETGLGQEVRGEGLVGLTRAFQYAGAKSVVVSLWEIHDASTSEFMQAFYAALSEGCSKDAALQRGMAALRKHPKWSHPYFWAAFALHGDWQT
ncbi:MAG TPA: CHAT domain-containing protein [Chthonomonadaceae bacterium]|nr:CHAT domain-containing protein [Chthonomonadaceae bacterium]